MILFGLTTFLVTVLAGGFGVTMLILRHPARLSVVECVCVSWLFGTGAVSLLLWICGAGLHGFALSATVAVFCLALGIYGWLKLRSRRVTLFFTTLHGLGNWLLLALLAVEIALAFFVAWKNPLGWDGSFNWENKARIAFASGGAIPATYYSSDSQTLSHPEYPLLVPFTELWLYLCVGESHQFLAKQIFPIFYIVGIALVASIGSRLSGRLWAGAGAAALLFFVPAFVRQSGGVASGYADVPLSIFYLAAVGYLVLFQSGNDPNMFRICAGALTLLPWIKGEGVVLWLVGGACALAVCWHKGKLRMGLSGVVPGVIVAASWQLFLRAMSAKPPHDFVKPTLESLGTNIGRVPEIAASVLGEFCRLNDWSFFWLLVAVAVIYQFVRSRDRRLLTLVATMFVPIAIYSVAYVFSSWPDFKSHMVYSLVRLLLQVTPIGCLFIAMALPSVQYPLNTAAGMESKTS